MKRKGTEVRTLMRLLGIGSNVVVGWRSTKDMYTFNSKKLLKALYHKEGAAQSEVDFFLENCAKKW